MKQNKTLNKGSLMVIDHGRFPYQRFKMKSLFTEYIIVNMLHTIRKVL